MKCRMADIQAVTMPEASILCKKSAAHRHWTMRCHARHLGANAEPPRKQVQGVSHHNGQIQTQLANTNIKNSTRILSGPCTCYTRSLVARLVPIRVTCVRLVLRPNRV